MNRPELRVNGLIFIIRVVLKLIRKWRIVFMSKDNNQGILVELHGCIRMEMRAEKDEEIFKLSTSFTNKMLKCSHHSLIIFSFSEPATQENQRWVLMSCCFCWLFVAIHITSSSNKCSYDWRCIIESARTVELKQHIAVWLLKRKATRCALRSRCWKASFQYKGESSSMNRQRVDYERKVMHLI